MGWRGVVGGVVGEPDIDEWGACCELAWEQPTLSMATRRRNRRGMSRETQSASRSTAPKRPWVGADLVSEDSILKHRGGARSTLEMTRAALLVLLLAPAAAWAPSARVPRAGRVVSRPMAEEAAAPAAEEAEAEAEPAEPPGPTYQASVALPIKPTLNRMSGQPLSQLAMTGVLLVKKHHHRSRPKRTAATPPTILAF